jgi:prolipoprotein diacylglyceryltransferase
MTYIYHIIIWLVLALLAFYASRRYHNARDYILFTYICLVGILLNIWKYIANNILEFSSQGLIMNSKILLGVGILNAIWFIYATYKVSKKKPQKEEDKN